VAKGLKQIERVQSSRKSGIMGT